MRRDTPGYAKVLARNLRNNQTEAERILWEKIQKRQIEGYRFQRQYCIGRYIADFYCSKANLVIEIDGKIHEEKEQAEYDKIREQGIKSGYIRVIRFKNEEIINNIDEVLKKLILYLKESQE